MTRKRFKFQLTVDSDSILISQVPDKNKSRVILTNLEEEELLQIAQSIIDANLQNKFIEILQESGSNTPVISSS